MPLSTELMQRHLHDYERLHGARPSRAVQEAFRRHHRVDELRMLVIRASLGEHINLAQRALAFGVLPLQMERVQRIAARAPNPEAVAEHLASAEAARDAVLLEQLRAEAAAFTAWERRRESGEGKATSGCGDADPEASELSGSRGAWRVGFTGPTSPKH